MIKSYNGRQKEKRATACLNLPSGVCFSRDRRTTKTKRRALNAIGCIFATDQKLNYRYIKESLVFDSSSRRYNVQNVTL